LRPIAGADAQTLVLHEIYASIQGESTYAGQPCTFVRTTACNLRCSYCDTPHAFTQGRPYSLDQTFAQVASLGLPLVEVTGGEPLLQPAANPLMSRLCDAGYSVLLETSGSLDISAVDPRVVRIVDFKTPSSGEEQANLWSNVDALRRKDEVKLVLGNRQDYDWAKDLIERCDLPARCTVLMGSVFGQLPAGTLAQWIVEDRLPVRQQLQMHKYIWDPAARGV